jgi:hypothetical protein
LRRHGRDLPNGRLGGGSVRFRVRVGRLLARTQFGILLCHLATHLPQFLLKGVDLALGTGLELEKHVLESLDARRVLRK